MGGQKGGKQAVAVAIAVAQIATRPQVYSVHCTKRTRYPYAYDPCGRRASSVMGRSGRFAGKLPVRRATKAGLEDVQAMGRLGLVGEARIDGPDCVALATEHIICLRL